MLSRKETESLGTNSNGCENLLSDCPYARSHTSLTELLLAKLPTSKTNLLANLKNPLLCSKKYFKSSVLNILRTHLNNLT